MVGSVSASEQNDDLQITNDTDTVSTGEDAVISVSDSGEVLGDAGTFTQLQSLIDGTAEGGTLTLPNDYSYNSDFGKTTGIEIKKSITINGNGKTIDGKNASRIFLINAHNVKLDKITFIDGKVTGEGGMINFASGYGNLTISNSQFYNANASSYGGAIKGNGQNSTIINCIFDHCWTGSNGGGINIFNERWTIKNCNFTNCYSHTSGAGLNFNVQACGFSLVENCYFAFNHARVHAGALETYSKNSTFINCTFINNTAEQNGGAFILLNGAPFTSLIDCKFYNNSATKGGAIYCNAVNCINTTIDRCIFDGNNATTDNGGAYYFNAANTTVSNSNFTNNYATNCGGAVYSNAANAKVDNCKFENNTAADGNNFYASTGNTITIVNCGFDEFYVSDAGTGDGLRVESPTSFTSAINSIEAGGIIYFIGTFTNLYSKTIDKNVIIQGYQNAAVINLQGKSARAFTVSANDVQIKGITIKNSQFADWGAAIYWTGDNGLLQYCTFENCDSTVNGGGIVSWYGNNGTLDNCTFINNKASYVTSNNGGDGGAIIWVGNSGTIKNSYFKNNTCNNLGGAIHITGGDSMTDLVITNCRFEENKAETINGRGGAIRIYGAGVKITYCNFTGNKASSGHGGAIYTEKFTDGILAHCKFDNNEALVGGAIYWMDDGSSITDCEFNGNHAVNGSAIYLTDNVNNFAIKDSSFTSNVATGVGTVSASNLTSLSLGGNTFSSNSVSSGASDYYFYSHTPSTITSSVVYVSQSSGSASNLGLTADSPTTFDHAYDDILEANGKIILLNEVFTNIVAKSIDKNITIVGSGATVLNGAGTKRFFTVTASGVTIENITFTNGKGDNGGAIQWSGDNGNLINCTFTGNTAANGGAVYWTGNNGLISKCTFSGNTGTTSARNIYTTKTLTLRQNTFDVTATLDSKQITYSGGDVALTGNFNAGTSGISFSGISISVTNMASVSASVSTSGAITASIPAPIPNQYTITLANTDSNGNTFVYSATPTNSVSVRATDIYISPSGTGSGVSASTPTTWDNVANKLTDTGTVHFTDSTAYSLSGKTISKAWTLTASSASNVVINGGSNTIFTITSSGFTIEKLTLISNTHPITASSTVTVRNSVLQNQIEMNPDKTSYTYGDTITISGSFGNIASSKITAYSGSTKIGESSGTSASYSVVRNGNLAVGSYTLTLSKTDFKEV